MGALSNFRRKLTGRGSPFTQEAAAVPDPPSARPELPESLVFRQAGREEISLGLRVVLGAAGHPADDSHVLDFMQFALRRGISLSDLWLAVDAADGTLLWAVLPIASPGRTLLLLGPADPPYRNGAKLAAVAGELVDHVCGHFAGRGVQLAQVLLDPADRPSHRLYEARGFGRVAELLYLQAAPRRKGAAPPPLPPGFTWTAYGPDAHDRFVAAISESYRHSLDCPSLNGLRDMDDVMAGHKASGEFDPALWLLLSETMDAGADTATRGVLLLSRTQPGDVLELVYLGLTPAARGRGLGDLLVRQALAATAAAGLSRLSLAVDAQNAPALKLYYRHGLRHVASKLALMRVLDDPRPAPAGAARPDETASAAGS